MQAVIGQTAFERSAVVAALRAILAGGEDGRKLVLRRRSAGRRPPLFQLGRSAGWCHGVAGRAGNETKQYKNRHPPHFGHLRDRREPPLLYYTTAPGFAKPSKTSHLIRGRNPQLLCKAVGSGEAAQLVPGGVLDLAPFITLAAFVGYRSRSATAAQSSETSRRRLHVAAAGLCMLGILGSHYVLIVHKVWSIGVRMGVRRALLPIAPFARTAFGQ
jgi:hypothetical protein